MHAYDERTDYDGMTRHGICRLQKGEFSKAGIMRLHLADFPFLPRSRKTNIDIIYYKGPSRHLK